MKRMSLGILAFFGWVVAGIWLADLFLKGRISCGLAQLATSVLFVVMASFILYLSDSDKEGKSGGAKG